MITSRLAVPADSSGDAHRRVFASASSIGILISEAFRSQSLRRVLAAGIYATALSAPASALNLAWNPNPENDIVGYQLKYGVQSGVHSTTIDAGPANKASVPGLQAGATYYFVVTATNQAGMQGAPSAEISYQIPATVPVNQPPVAAAKSFSTNEDSSVSVPLTANDPDGNALTYAVVNFPTKGTLTGIAPALTYVPNADFNGTDSFTFQARDGSANSNIATVSITVVPVNDAPVAVSKSIAATEDTPVAIALTASDKEGSALTYSIPTGPTKGVLTGSAPNIIYTPGADFNGADSFTYQARDGSADSNTATVSITVAAVNDAPVAVSKSVATTEDTPVAITLTASDKEGSALTYTIVGGLTKGVLTGTAPNVIYTPNADSNGTDSFTYQARDGSANSNVATISITVAAVNDAPVAASSSTTTSGGVPVPVTLAATDKDSTTLTYLVIKSPANGTLSGSVPALTYTPAEGFSGVDSFTYQASDGAASSNTATVTITVIEDAPPPPDSGPVFATNPMLMTLAEDQAISGTLVASTPGGTSPLVFAKVSGPSWLTVSSGGQLGGTPGNTDVGTNTFSVRVSDSSNASATANLTVTVTNTNDAPVFKINPITRPSGSEATLYQGGTIADTAADADAGDSIRFSKISGPAWLAVSADGALSGTPPTASAGKNTFVVAATDKAGAKAEAMLVISIVAQGLPLPWEVEDLGKTGLTKSATLENGIFKLSGGGQLAGTADSGCFAWQMLGGDGSITVRVQSPLDRSKASRVGVMVRDTLAANSKQFFMGIDGEGSYCWSFRSGVGNETKNVFNGRGTPPAVWVHIIRKGRTMEAWRSADARTWTFAGSTTVEFATHCYIGLYTCSGDTSANSGMFDKVKVIR